MAKARSLYVVIRPDASLVLAVCLRPSHPLSTLGGVPPRRNIPLPEVRVGLVKLFLDDLAQIDSIVRSVANDSVVLRAEDYELDSIAEIGELGLESLRSVAWESRSPTLSVRLSNRVDIHGAAGDLELRGAVELIGDVLRRCQRPIYRAFARSWVLAVVALAVIGGLALTRSFLWVGPEALAAFWWYTAMRAGIERRVVILSALRAERSSFWQRKGDDLVLLVLGAVVGSLVTGLAGFLTS